MADKTAIANLAAAHLGEDPVDNLVNANNKMRKILAHMDMALDALLERQGWLCALVYASIEASAGDNANFKYDYRYDLPGVALRVWTVDSCEAWELGTVTDEAGATRKVVRCNASGPLSVAYVRRVAWEALTPGLVDAVALDIAARACGPVTGDYQRAAALRNLAAQAVQIAVGIDGMQEGGQEAVLPDTLGALRASAC